jgi:hypothetical protein
MVSAAHPNPAIPAMAEAIDPVLNVVKTRPKRGAGVTSCNTPQTIGMNRAVLPPMIRIKAPAIKGAVNMLSPHIASPPTAIDRKISVKRPCRSP